MTNVKSTTQSRTAQKRLLTAARDRAREGEDVRPGTDAFWGLMADHLSDVSSLMMLVASEIDEEIRASREQFRPCQECGAPVFKKHVRGRWPLRCDSCR